MTRQKLSGFTLIELIMTVAIIGLLASITLPLAKMSIQHSKEADLRLALRQIRDGIDAYKQAYEDGNIARTQGKSGYPESLQALVDGVNNIKNPDSHSRIYFLRSIPRDPFENDLSKTNEETWGKRSYESSAEDPQEGVDVFDVYSLNEGTGLNGIPYRKW